MRASTSRQTSLFGDVAMVCQWLSRTHTSVQDLQESLHDTAKNALPLSTRTDSYQKLPSITKKCTDMACFLSTSANAQELTPCAALLACRGHCHATERQMTGLQTTGSQLISHPRFRQARFRTTLFSHVFQPRLPATSSDVPFGSRTLCISAELVVLQRRTSNEQHRRVAQRFTTRLLERLLLVDPFDTPHAGLECCEAT